MDWERNLLRLDKWNQEIALWAVDSGNVSSYRSYKNVPFLISSSGYGLFINSSYPMVFRMGSESSVTYSIHIDDSQLDMFLFFGPSYKQILKTIRRIDWFLLLFLQNGPLGSGFQERGIVREVK